MVKELENKYPKLMMESDSLKFVQILRDLKASADSTQSGEMLDVEERTADSLPYGKEGLKFVMTFFGMTECGIKDGIMRFCKG